VTTKVVLSRSERSADDGLTGRLGEESEAGADGHDRLECAGR